MGTQGRSGFHYDDLQQKLDEASEKGWELVSATEYCEEFFLFFKRRSRRSVE